MVAFADHDDVTNMHCTLRPGYYWVPEIQSR
jgi:hypothetical protein